MQISPQHIKILKKANLHGSKLKRAKGAWSFVELRHVDWNDFDCQASSFWKKSTLHTKHINKWHSIIIQNISWMNKTKFIVSKLCPGPIKNPYTAYKHNQNPREPCNIPVTSNDTLTFYPAPTTIKMNFHRL